jgi:hypothetical protein
MKDGNKAVYTEFAMLLILQGDLERGKPVLTFKIIPNSAMPNSRIIGED